MSIAADDRNTIIENYMILRAVLGETGLFAQLTKEYPYVERLFSLVLDEKLNLPFQHMTKEQKIDAWQNWSNTILAECLTSERMLEIWSAWADKHEQIGFSHEQRLRLQKTGKAKDDKELKKLDSEEKYTVIYTLVHFAELSGININILNGIEPLSLGVTVDKNFIDGDLKTIATVNLRNDFREHTNERIRKSKENEQEVQIEKRGRLPYGVKYKMILENPLGIDFAKLKKAISSELKEPVKGIGKIIEEAYSLNGIVKIICINHENLYVDTSRYYVPDSWKPLIMTYNVLTADNSYICRKGLKYLNIKIDMPNSVESVIKDIEKRDLGYLRPVTMTVKKPAKSKP
ncbi:MAG: hypothetical protein QME45_05265 [Clostridiales bacterium]|nr:hypothetical protein [Clostridiales bacterium]